MNREVGQEQILRDIFRLLRRQKWVILATVAVAVGAAIAYAALKTPEYSATSKIQFVDQSQQLAPLGISTPITGLTAAQQASQGAERVTSAPVVAAVAKDVNSDLTPSEIKDSVTTSVNPDNALVSIGVSAGKAKLAADLANAYADETKRILTDSQRSQLLDQARSIAKSVKGLDDTSIQKQTSLQKVAQLRSAAKVITPVSVANTASEPSKPSSPQPVKDGILALFLGLIFGVVLAFLRDSLDRRLTDPHDIQHQLGIPMVGYVDDSALGGIGFARNGREPAAHGLEPFRILRSNVEFLSDKRVRSLAVTSPVAEEGKSTVAAGLATAAALADRRVLLVECDLRRPVFAERFDIESTPGLTDWAAGNAKPGDVIQPVSIDQRIGEIAPDVGEERPESLQTLTVIPAGSFSARPAEVLASQRFKQFVAQVSQVYDLVVFDCAPLLPVGDALEVLPVADATLLCIRIDQTTREQALAAKGAIEHLPDGPIGLVLTGVRSGREGYYYGYYPSTPSRPGVVVQPPGPG